jgi:hypothetical protein
MTRTAQGLDQQISSKHGDGSYQPITPPYTSDTG